MQKRCLCGRFFTPPKRLLKRQKTCGLPECKKKLKKRTQAEWKLKNPNYFNKHYEIYIKPMRQKKREESLLKQTDKKPIKARKAEVIKDVTRTANPYLKLILLVPADQGVVIKDEILLQRVDRHTFAALGG